MNRRRFLANLFAAAPALMLDPERLLWVPGAKTIFLPPVVARVPLTLADWAKRLDPNGTHTAIIELLSQSNDILEDLIWMEPDALRRSNRSFCREVAARD